jgi:hypothetical protein
MIFDLLEGRGPTILALTFFIGLVTWWTVYTVIWTGVTELLLPYDFEFSILYLCKSTAQSDESYSKFSLLEITTLASRNTMQRGSRCLFTESRSYICFTIHVGLMHCLGGTWTMVQMWFCSRCLYGFEYFKRHGMLVAQNSIVSWSIIFWRPQIFKVIIVGHHTVSHVYISYVSIVAYIFFEWCLWSRSCLSPKTKDPFKPCICLILSWLLDMYSCFLRSNLCCFMK